MSHTQGKLATNADRIESEKEHGWANDGWIIAKCEGPDAFANTRRLVACWNLLLPFTTEEIEAGIDLEKLVRENAALNKGES